MGITVCNSRSKPPQLKPIMKCFVALGLLAVAMASAEPYRGGYGGGYGGRGGYGGGYGGHGGYGGYRGKRDADAEPEANAYYGYGGYGGYGVYGGYGYGRKRR